MKKFLLPYLTAASSLVLVPLAFVSVVLWTSGWFVSRLGVTLWMACHWSARKPNCDCDECRDYGTLEKIWKLSR